MSSHDWARPSRPFWGFRDLCIRVQELRVQDVGLRTLYIYTHDLYIHIHIQIYTMIQFRAQGCQVRSLQGFYSDVGEGVQGS